MSRRNASRRSSSASKPAWVWFVLGNFVGGFVVFIIFLNGLKQESARESGTAHRSPEASEAEDKRSQPRFDFYTLLQESEVAVPEPRKPKPARRDTAPRDDMPREATTGGDAGGDKKALVYILQAASFRDVTEAEKLRAQLTLANLNVQVETASDSRGTWYRVLVGPYPSRSGVAKAREVLADHKLMPLVLKRPAR